MKNVVIVVLVAATAGMGWYTLSKYRIDVGQKGKLETVRRGDLTLPINASGEVRPNRRVEIKSEASGEVIEIHKYAGDAVSKGDLIIRLDKREEQWAVERATADMKSAEARLETTRIALRRAETSDLKTAEAQVAQLESEVELHEFRKQKMENLAPNLRNEEEMLQRDTALRSARAQLDSARAGLDAAKLAVDRAKQDVRQAEAAYEIAKRNLADSQRRLEKTDITAPIDGIIGTLNTQIGEVIQGGKSTITGGTVLAVVLDVDRLVVRADVDEADIGRVLEIAPEWAKPGNEGTVTMPEDLQQAAASIEHLPGIEVESFRDQEFVGVIERIFPEPKRVNNVTTYMVDIVLTSDNRSMLFPGMRADVEFTAEHVAGVLLCPNEAIREGPTGKLGVYIPKEGADPNAAETEFVPCVFGLDNGVYSEVKEGLAEGQEVYTKLPVDLDERREQRKR